MLGFEKYNDGNESSNYINFDYPFIYTENITGVNKFFGSMSMSTFINTEQKEVTAEYILNLTWEEPKKEPPFKPFDKVLWKDKDHIDSNWRPCFYSDLLNGRGEIGDRNIEIIPYEGNEHLCYTSDDTDNDCDE